MKTLDCRDMACPKPVNLVQQTLEAYPNHQALHVIVNTEMSCENILIYAQNRGYFVEQNTKQTQSLESQLPKISYAILRQAANKNNPLPIQPS